MCVGKAYIRQAGLAFMARLFEAAGRDSATRKSQNQHQEVGEKDDLREKEGESTTSANITTTRIQNGKQWDRKPPRIVSEKKLYRKSYEVRSDIYVVVRSGEDFLLLKAPAPAIKGSHDSSSLTAHVSVHQVAAKTFFPTSHT